MAHNYYIKNQTAKRNNKAYYTFLVLKWNSLSRHKSKLKRYKVKKVIILGVQKLKLYKKRLKTRI